MKLKVLSYNIHKGFSPTNTRFVLRAMREALEVAQPDIVFLQEVQGDHKKRKLIEHPNEAQFEYLADRLWPHHCYGKNAAYDSGHHGNAILSRYPIEAFENIDLTTGRLAKRGMLHVVIKHPQIDKHLHLLCVHLDLTEKSRSLQAQKISERINSVVPIDSPCILAGDFNDWSEKFSSQLKAETRLMEAFKAVHGSYAKTFPAILPALKLDRIYYRGLKPVNAQCLSGQPWRSLSDHLPIEVEFKS